MLIRTGGSDSRPAPGRGAPINAPLDDGDDMTPELFGEKSADLNSTAVPATRRYLPRGHVRDDDPAHDYADTAASAVDWDIEDGFLDSEEVVVKG